MIRPLEESWNAIYFDGRSARRHEVAVWLATTGIRILTSSGEEHWWPYDELRRSSEDFDGAALQFERCGSDPAEQIVIEDERFLTAVQQYAPGALPERSVTSSLVGWQRLVLVSLLVVVVATVLYSWGRRVFARVAVHVVPVSAEERIGRSVVLSLAPAHEQCHDEKLQSAVDEIMARLSEATTDRRYRFKVSIARNPMVNALAAPGGQILLFSGLIEKSPKPEHLAAVLAHEMQHVIQRHSTRAILQMYSGQAILSLLSGDTNSTPVFVRGAATLLDLHYQREDENSADQRAVRLLQQAKIDPRALVEFFGMIDEIDTGGAHSYLSSHPQRRERIAAARALIEPSTFDSEPLLAGRQWPELRKACGSTAD